LAAVSTGDFSSAVSMRKFEQSRPVRKRVRAVTVLHSSMLYLPNVHTKLEP
jgi:hypothetical protein